MRGGVRSDRLANCRSYQNLTNQRRRKSVTMAPKNKSGLPKLFYFALNARRLLISAHITQQEPRGSSVEFHISWPFVKLRLVLLGARALFGRQHSTDVPRARAPGETRRLARAHRFCSQRTKTGTLHDCKGIDSLVVVHRTGLGLQPLLRVIRWRCSRLVWCAYVCGCSAAQLRGS